MVAVAFRYYYVFALSTSPVMTPVSPHCTAGQQKPMFGLLSNSKAVQTKGQTSRTEHSWLAESALPPHISFLVVSETLTLQRFPATPEISITGQVRKFPVFSSDIFV